MSQTKIRSFTVQGVQQDGDQYTITLATPHHSHAQFAARHFGQAIVLSDARAVARTVLSVKDGNRIYRRVQNPDGSHHDTPGLTQALVKAMETP